MDRKQAAIEMTSALDLMREREEVLYGWIAENGPEQINQQTHLDSGTPERLFWHHGYMTALQDVLALLGGNASTLKH